MKLPNLMICPSCWVFLKFGDGVDTPPVWCPQCQVGADTWEGIYEHYGYEVLEFQDSLMIYRKKGFREHEGQTKVAKFRNRYEDEWYTPPPYDAWGYLVTEVAEIGDGLLRLGYGLLKRSVRTHDVQPDLSMELGDAYMMLCTLANLLCIDLNLALDQSLAKVEDTIRRRREEG